MPHARSPGVTPSPRRRPSAGYTATVRLPCRLSPRTARHALRGCCHANVFCRIIMNVKENLYTPPRANTPYACQAVRRGLILTPPDVKRECRRMLRVVLYIIEGTVKVAVVYVALRCCRAPPIRCDAAGNVVPGVAHATPPVLPRRRPSAWQEVLGRALRQA